MPAAQGFLHGIGRGVSRLSFAAQDCALLTQLTAIGSYWGVFILTADSGLAHRFVSIEYRAYSAFDASDRFRPTKAVCSSSCAREDCAKLGTIAENAYSIR